MFDKLLVYKNYVSSFKLQINISFLYDRLFPKYVTLVVMLFYLYFFIRHAYKNKISPLFIYKECPCHYFRLLPAIKTITMTRGAIFILTLLVIGCSANSRRSCYQCSTEGSTSADKCSADFSTSTINSTACPDDHLVCRVSTTYLPHIKLPAQ